MKDIKFDIEQITVNVPIRQLKARWVSTMPREKVKPEFHYRHWVPAGYTDDLGIIADRNQWVEEQVPGWYSSIDPQDYNDIRDWCEKNLEEYAWKLSPYQLILRREEDVSWFMLRFS